jgi:hypothetical protein
MARQRIDVEVALFDVFAVIAFVRHDAEVAFFEDGIALVPEGHRPAEDLIAVAEAGDAILAPAIRARTGVIVREERPRISICTVVLAHGAPGAIGEIGPPVPPARQCLRTAGEPDPLRIRFGWESHGMSGV